MLVKNNGYLKYDEVLKLEQDFCIFLTHKKTVILIITEECYSFSGGTIFYPKKDKLPYVDEQGKKIVTCVEKIFDSKLNKITELKKDLWNNKNQIMCYERFCLFEYNK